jgi:hypothetical protein
MFTPQSFDDKVLEVVALFGVIHVATSRVPKVVRLQNHRIAQVRYLSFHWLPGGAPTSPKSVQSGRNFSTPYEIRPKTGKIRYFGRKIQNLVTR